MENALLIGLSRQTALARNLDIIANNMANMRTSGFKSEQLMFDDYLMPVAAHQDMEGSDRRLLYVIDNGLARDFEQGSLQPTGNPLDVAISGEGWLVLDTPNGERYTRNGELKINIAGELVDNSGNRVLGEGGPITFGSTETDITFSRDGTISTNEGEKGRLRVVTFDQAGHLVKEGDNLFSNPDAPLPASGYTVAQGTVEASNVSGVLETARMIEVTRAYTSTVQMLERMQELRKDAIQQLAALPA